MGFDCYGWTTSYNREFLFLSCPLLLSLYQLDNGHISCCFCVVKEFVVAMRLIYNMLLAFSSGFPFLPTYICTLSSSHTYIVIVQCVTDKECGCNFSSLPPFPCLLLPSGQRSGSGNREMRSAARSILPHLPWKYKNMSSTEDNDQPNKQDAVTCRSRVFVCLFVCLFTNTFLYYCTPLQLYPVPKLLSIYKFLNRSLP